MNIAIIGNSHLAALKLGWDEIAPNYPDITLVFFGAKGDLLSDLKIQDGDLVATDNTVKKHLRRTSGGLDRINFKEFDIVLLDGLRSGFWFLFKNTLTKYQIYSHYEYQQQVISKDCFKQLCHDQMKICLLFQLASLVKQITSIPVFITPEPLPSQLCLINRPRQSQYLKNNDWKIIKDVYYSELIHLCHEFNSVFLPQPEHTIVDDIFSKAEFSSLFDYAHMNKEFGKEMLVSFFNAIKNR